MIRSSFFPIRGEHRTFDVFGTIPRSKHVITPKFIVTDYYNTKTAPNSRLGIGIWDGLCVNLHYILNSAGRDIGGGYSSQNRGAYGMNIAIALFYVIISAFSLLFGMLLLKKPEEAIDLQQKIYEKINWKIEPVSRSKEIRNMRIMGTLLIIFTLSILAFVVWGKV